MTRLADSLHTLRNVHVSAVEEKGTVVFLHQVIEGAADRSYGVYVAELAGLPKQVTTRAEALLTELEHLPQRPTSASEEQQIDSAKTETAATVEEPQQLSLFPADEETKPKQLTKKERSVLAKMAEVDVLHLTPLQALEKINEWQKQLNK